MLSCREITEQASAYLDRDLPLSGRLQFRLHLFMCRHCRRFMDQLSTTIKLTPMIEEPPTDPEVEKDQVKRLLAAHKKQH